MVSPLGGSHIVLADDVKVFESHDAVKERVQVSLSVLEVIQSMVA